MATQDTFCTIIHLILLLEAFYILRIQLLRDIREDLQFFVKKHSTCSFQMYFNLLWRIPKDSYLHLVLILFLTNVLGNHLL
jgi:hypothetical protein